MITYASLKPADITCLALFWVHLATTAIAVLALRGIFYPVLEAHRVHLHLTGLAVGLVVTVNHVQDLIAPVLLDGLANLSPRARRHTIYFGI